MDYNNDINNRIVRYLSNEMSDVEKIDFDRELSVNIELNNQYLLYKNIWEQSKNLNKGLLDINVDNEWNSFKSNISSENKSKKLNFKVYLKIAAVLILFLTIYAVFNKYALNRETLYVSKSDVVNINFETNTHVNLNKNSELKVAKNQEPNQFCVNLKGEAFFEVEKKPERKFLVKTDRLSVVVHGTSFTVKEFNKDCTLVTVNTGIVEVIANSDTLNRTTIYKGQSATLVKNGKLILTDSIVNPNYLSWKTKQFVFENNTLNSIILSIGEVYNLKFRFENQELKNCRMSGVFKNQSADSILKVIEETLGIKFSKSSSGTYTISGKSCGSN